jgi:hypothetical protein
VKHSKYLFIALLFNLSSFQPAIAAVNDAVRRVEATTQEKMSGVTAGMGLPPGMKLPF